MAERKQVRPLPGPEPLYVSNFIPDNFAPARLDTSASDKLRNLQRAVGIVGAALNVKEELMKEDPEAKRQRELDELAKYQRWRGSVTTDEFMAKTRSGEVPWTENPRITELVQREYGKNLSIQMHESIIKDIDDGKIDLTSPDLNVERLYLEKAAPYLQKLESSPLATLAFRKGMDSGSAKMKELYHERRGQAVVQYQENKALEAFRNHYKQAAAQGLAPEDAAIGARRIYKDAGPIDNGGVLGLKFPDIDRIHMSELDLMARDPAMAKYVIPALTRDRVSVDGGKALPSYLNTPKWSRQAASMVETAQKTIDTADHQQQMIKIAEQNKQIFLEGGKYNRWSQIQDVTVTGPYGSTTTYSAADQKKHAIALAEQELKQKHGENLSLGDLAELYADAGVENTKWTGALEEAYAAGMVAAQSTKTASPDQLQKLDEAISLYSSLAARVPSYINKGLSAEAKSFYQFAYGMKRIDFSNEVIAAKWRSYMERTNEGKVVSVPAEDVTNEIKKYTTANRTWTQAMLTGGGEIENVDDVAVEIYDEVKVLVNTGMKTDKAVELVMNNINKRGVIVNGNYVPSDGFLQKEDTPLIQGYLSALWDKYGTQIKAESIWDVNGPEDLIIRKGPYRRWGIYTKDGMEVIIIPDDKAPPGIGPDRQPKRQYISEKMIRDWRQQKHDENLKRIMKKRDEPMIKPPHKYLQDLFGMEGE